MRWSKSFLITILMTIGCNDENDGLDTSTDTDTSADTDVGEDGYPSTFTTGKYRTTLLTLNPIGEGLDFTDDGVSDNNLPSALGLVNVAIADQDLSFDGFNTLIATSIEGHLLNILLEANHEDLHLSVDVLAGSWDADLETMGIDAMSYDTEGNPLTVFAGNFSTETDFGTTAALARLPVTFLPDTAPLLVPLERAHLIGILEPSGSCGLIAGVIPAQEMIDDVITPLVPEEGSSTMTKEEILDLVNGIKDNETLIDVDLGDGRRGISACFQFEAAPLDF